MAHRHSLDKEPFKGGIILIVTEQCDPSGRTVQDVVNLPTGGICWFASRT